MLSRTIKAMRRRVGPVGLSLIAAALTAAALAAVSTAAEDDGDKQGRDDGPRSFHRAMPAPPELSEEDQAKLDEFRQCMEDNGAPAPPEPGELKEGERPEPPSEADIKKMRKAEEACAEKLPEGLPGPHGGPMGCGPGGPPPPGAGSNREGTAVPAPPSGGSQGDVMVAPRGSTS
jgi:hypothetical protein